MVVVENSLQVTSYLDYQYLLGHAVYIDSVSAIISSKNSKKFFTLKYGKKKSIKK